MKKKLIAAFIMATAISLLAGCGEESDESSAPSTLSPVIVDDTPEPTVEDTPAPSDEEPEEPEEVIPEHSYRSELTNEWIDESLKDQRPIAVMVDNEKTALPHFGLTEADVVYEIMNSTANGRITRFMAVVKDWGNITQFGSIRSTRPTNIMLAAEWNAVLCHDGGPFYINDWLAKPYIENLSGGFARFSNGKATEFTEYLTYDTYSNPTTGNTYDGLKQRFEKANYSTTYSYDDEYYVGPHFTFAKKEIDFSDRSDAKNVTEVDLSSVFPHNRSMLKYNEETGTYDYYEYGEAHLDPLHDNAPLTFKNLLLQNTTFSQLDSNGYLIYNAIDISSLDGYYITNGKAIEVTWIKDGENHITRYYDKATGEEIEINTGKTYISLIPSDSWSQIYMK